tara:strand:- start:180 stop:725 length:546 start_codon:yes stop_codon:yes gene_type:complete
MTIDIKTLTAKKARIMAESATADGVLATVTILTNWGAYQLQKSGNTNGYTLLREFIPSFVKKPKGLTVANLDKMLKENGVIFDKEKKVYKLSKDSKLAKGGELNTDNAAAFENVSMEAFENTINESNEEKAKTSKDSKTTIQDKIRKLAEQAKKQNIRDDELMQIIASVYGVELKLVDEAA